MTQGTTAADRREPEGAEAGRTEHGATWALADFGDASSTRPGVHPPSELPAMWDNKAPHYLSQYESGFLLFAAKSNLADTLQETEVTSKARVCMHSRSRPSGTMKTLHGLQSAEIHHNSYCCDSKFLGNRYEAFSSFSF